MRGPPWAFILKFWLATLACGAAFWSPGWFCAGNGSGRGAGGVTGISEERRVEDGSADAAVEAKLKTREMWFRSFYTEQTLRTCPPYNLRTTNSDHIQFRKRFCSTRPQNKFWLCVWQCFHDLQVKPHPFMLAITSQKVILINLKVFWKAAIVLGFISVKNFPSVGYFKQSKKYSKELT